MARRNGRIRLFCLCAADAAGGPSRGRFRAEADRQPCVGPSRSRGPAASDRAQESSRNDRARLGHRRAERAGGPGGGTLGVSCTPQGVKVQGETDITVAAGSALADVFTATSCLKIDNTFNVMPAR